MPELNLSADNVKEMIREAYREDEPIVIWCIRKTAVSKAGGPDVGDLYDLSVVRKPDDYVRLTNQDRRAQDNDNGVLTVFANNRRSRVTGQWGDWRRVNISQVRRVTFKQRTYEIAES